MKKIYLVHCWDGTSDDGWYPWIDKQLSGENTKFIRFDMPNTSTPIIEEWVTKLNSEVDSLDENTYFIGHSIGCQTIMRYLDTKEIREIGGILFVAPWLDLLPEAVSDEESYNTAKPWINTPIHFEKIKKLTNNINCIFSNDDYFVPLEQATEFKNKLNANTYVVKNKGHISQDDNVFELKEILDLSKEMLGETKKTLIMAYMGTGKTELENRYDNVIDFDFQDYKYIYDESIRHLPIEQRKGSVNLRIENPNYPDNFLNDAIKLLNEGKIVVSPFIEHVFKAFDSTDFKSKAADVRIILVCPARDNFNEYIQRFKQRGNSDEFIARREKEFPSLVDLFEQAANYEKILIKPGEFLSSTLEEYDITLKPKEKIKNKIGGKIK